MHALTTIIPTLLLLLTPLATAHGPYIPSNSGSLPKYPTGTAPYPTGISTGILPPPLTSINPGGPIESATTCPLPTTTVTVTTDVTVTVTVPPGSGGTGTAAPSASVSGGLKVRRGPLEMRGLGEREARGFWG